jgi:hypothetical protein
VKSSRYACISQSDEVPVLNIVHYKPLYNECLLDGVMLHKVGGVQMTRPTPKLLAASNMPFGQ